MKRLGFAFLSGLVLCGASVIGCSSAAESTGSNGNGSSGTGAGGGAAAGTGLGGVSGTGPIIIGGSGTGSTGGGGASGPEVCDGVDNDGDGKIDNVDAGQDGLCDCLLIGFLGSLVGDAAGGGEDAFKNWLVSKSSMPVDVIGATEPLTTERLSKLQVLVIGNLEERAVAGGFSADELAVFQDWVQTKGGGVISLAGYRNTNAHMGPTNQLLAFTGMQYDLTGYENAAARPEGIFKDLTTLNVAGSTNPILDQVSAIAAQAGYPILGDGTPVIAQAEPFRSQSYNLGMSKITSPDQTNGRVFLYFDEWITQQSLWVNRTDLQVARFWLDALLWVSPQITCQITIPPIIR